MIILFDGVCNLCNGVVRFIIKRDKQNVFKFATLQSEYGMDFLASNNLHSAPLETIILIDGEKIYTQSDAVITILKALGGIWKLAVFFKIIPKSIRNFIYHLIAKYRYRIFGKRDTCMAPTEKMRSKFIEL